MKHRTFQHELMLYEDSFNRFVHDFDLPKEWFEVSDHVAVKCADAEDYTTTCDDLSGQTVDGVWQIELDGRYLGSAQLRQPIVFSDHSFSWIEIMQPRPGKETAHGFVEHTEFFFPDFGAVERRLSELGIAYEMQQNPGHKWINIGIDDFGREIKINDKVLADVVAWEREEGHLQKRDN